MAQALLITCCVLCCCSLVLGGVYAYPFPQTQTGSYGGYTEVATGRVFFDKNGDAFQSSLESVCADNCTADFTCKGFNTWTQNGKVLCFKQKETPNPWLSVPDYIVNKSQSKIFVKN
jgi:hypothetical protein